MNTSHDKKNTQKGCGSGCVCQTQETEKKGECCGNGACAENKTQKSTTIIKDECCKEFECCGKGKCAEFVEKNGVCCGGGLCENEE